MAVQCANCGEELLGAVNRCWRCGQTLVAHAGPVDLPPIRRAPIAGRLDQPPQAVIEAMVADGPLSAPSPERRRGSPFANFGTPTSLAASAPISGASVAMSRRQASVAPRAAGIASIVLGLVALAVAITFSPGALLISIAGIGFGVWGLYATNRMMGVAGLVLCCIALALSAFLLTVDVYVMLYGVNPFLPTAPAMPPPVE